MEELIQSKEKVQPKKIKIDKHKTLFMASFLAIPIINFLIFFRVYEYQLVFYGVSTPDLRRRNRDVFHDGKLSKGF